MKVEVKQQDIEQFLYHEADLLDRWQLMEWSELYADNGRYMVPPTDKPDGQGENTLFIINDDKFRIVERAKRLLKKEAHVEFPHSTTRRLISNVLIRESKENSVKVAANFVVFRTKRESLFQFVGHYEYILAVQNNEFKIKEKRVILDLDSLRPQGKVSIVL